MEEIVECIKDLISPYMGDVRVYDLDVCIALGITKGSLAARKQRNSIPYRVILEWCHKTGIDPMHLFYKKGEL